RRPAACRTGGGPAGTSPIRGGRFGDPPRARRRKPLLSVGHFVGVRYAQESTSPPAKGIREANMAETRYHTTPPAISTMPPGIPYIVGNEAAERFSFYGMKAILTVFMTRHLLD